MSGPGNDITVSRTATLPDRVRAELHSQYRMVYVPPRSKGEAEQWREILVELTRHEDLVVRSRRGYYSHSRQAP